MSSSFFIKKKLKKKIQKDIKKRETIEEQINRLQNELNGCNNDIDDDILETTCKNMDNETKERFLDSFNTYCKLHNFD